jgi:hypothetical protein
MREIRVYGALAKFLKRRVFRAEVASAAEAVRFLVANFPAVEKFMADRHFRVSLNERDLALEEIHEPSGQQVIRIVPVVAGAGAVGRILAGVALIALSFVSFGAGAWAGLGGFGATAAFTASGSLAAFGLGATLVLGGIAQLLTPMPVTPSENSDPRKSYSFSSIQNVNRQNVPVPIVYGETIVGSIVINSGITVTQVTS